MTPEDWEKQYAVWREQARESGLSEKTSESLARGLVDSGQRRVKYLGDFTVVDDDSDPHLRGAESVPETPEGPS